MLKRFLLPLASFIALAFAVTQMLEAQQKPAPATSPVAPAQSPYARQLAGAGIVEPETENIAVGTHVPGVVAHVAVKVGDTVRPGDPLFRLDDRHIRAELEARLASLASAQAQADKLDQSPRPEELPPARAKLDESEANVRDQELMYARLQRLESTRAISEEEVTRRKMGVEIARAQQSRAEAELRLLQAGAWVQDKKLAAAAVAVAQAQAQQTRTELDRLEMKSPRVLRDGPDTTAFEVLQVNVRPGEYVGGTPGTALVVLGHVGRLHVRVDIDENDIHRFRKGLPGVAKLRGNPAKEFPLKFVRIEPYVIPKKSLTGANTERVDTRVLQVIYAIEGEALLFVGQQVDVFLDAK